MKAKVYNLNKDIVSEIEIDDKIFNRPWQSDLVHQVVLAYQANRRQPWSHVKDRSEVRGGGRKPWKQKGTGRARQGSIRAPQWRGGGKAHGPVKQRDYSQKLNDKMRRAALHSVLSRKLADNQLHFIDSLKLDTFKTKEWHAKLSKFLGPAKLNGLLVVDSANKNVFRGVRNLAKVGSNRAADLNAEILLKHRQILIEAPAVSQIK